MTLAEQAAMFDRIVSRHEHDDNGAFAPGGSLNHGYGYAHAHRDRSNLLVIVHSLSADVAKLQAELRALGAGLDAIGTAARRLTRPGADDE